MVTGHSAVTSVSEQESGHEHLVWGYSTLIGSINNVEILWKYVEFKKVTYYIF